MIFGIKLVLKTWDFYLGQILGQIIAKRFGKNKTTKINFSDPMMSAKNLKLPTVKIEPEVDKRSLMDKMKERQLAKKV